MQGGSFASSPCLTFSYNPYTAKKFHHIQKEKNNGHSIAKATKDLFLWITIEIEISCCSITIFRDKPHPSSTFVPPSISSGAGRREVFWVRFSWIAIKLQQSQSLYLLCLYVGRFFASCPPPLYKGAKTI